MQIPVLLETRQYLVLNKPHGLNVERLPQGFPSVEEWVEKYQLQAGIKKPYTGIVHRLDRPVSGVLIVAKKKQALKLLNEQFREGQIQKHYLAIVQGKPPHQKDKLVHWIRKDQLNKKAIAFQDNRKQTVKGVLHYELLEEGKGLSLLKIKPITGKFHQIRVQLASLGCPILGDKKYGASLPYQNDSIALQAQSIRFKDPTEGHKIFVEVADGLQLSI